MKELYSSQHELGQLLQAYRDKKNISAFGLEFGDRNVVVSLLSRSVQTAQNGSDAHDLQISRIRSCDESTLPSPINRGNHAPDYPLSQSVESTARKGTVQNNTTASDPIVYVCNDFVGASAAFRNLKCLAEGVYYLPAKPDVLLISAAESIGTKVERLRTLLAVAKGEARIVVTTAESMLQLYPSRLALLDHLITIDKGSGYDLINLAKTLVSIGYSRQSQIEAIGQFSLRGDILDIWTVGDVRARIEFFGDDVESIRALDIATLVSGEALEQVEICPLTEVFDEHEKIEAVVADLMRGKLSDKCKEVLSDIAVKEFSGNISCLLPRLTHSTLSQFMERSVLVIDETKGATDTFQVTLQEHQSRYKSLLESGQALPIGLEQLLPIDKAIIWNGNKIAFHKILTQNRIFTPEILFEFKSMALPNYTRNFKALLEDVKMWRDSGYKITLYCGSLTAVANIQEFFAQNNVRPTDNLIFTDKYLELGYIFHEERVVGLASPSLTAAHVKKVLSRSKSEIFTLPEVGDYVVHSVHGVGIYDGIVKLATGNSQRDYLVIRFRDSDKLYVPIENMDNLSKYVSGSAPTLNKIGGADFAKAKDKVRKAVKQMAFDLLELYASRAKAGGYKYTAGAELLTEFEESFPFNETADQLQAIEDGLADLSSGKIMDRLLCGDVGYGKTEVALRIAFKVILEGKQVAFVSPTTILAKQHFHTVIKRMSDFGVNIVSLTRFDSASVINNNINEIATGRADIIVGTHRVLSKDVIFKDLGLLVLDEEQRFGVADKEKIKKLKTNVNVLSLSATPIPRTLHMSMIGIRDISILDTPPMDRIPVQTYVTELSDGLIKSAVEREVSRGGQAFIVYNRVETIDKFANNVRQLLPGLSVLVAHGQMAEDTLEERLTEFAGGRANVLISSTIIENGIDIPNANTMIVVNADCLGLSQLYQLRGRVGRSNRLAYVFFCYEGDKVLTETAYKRLEAITQFTEFGSGFKIAMRDLEIRGAGNVLGREQHGHMERVGYDMYCKLLSEAVETLRTGVEAKADREVKVIFDNNAFVPDDYISDNEWRMRLYSRISSLKTVAEREKLYSDMRDIYGAVPDCVANLLTVGLVKNLAMKINASKVAIRRAHCYIEFGKVSDISAEVHARMNKFPLAVLKLEEKPIISWGSSSGNTKEMIKFLIG